MNDDELGRLLSGAFDAGARDAVGDDRMPPPPRFALPADEQPHRGIGRFVLPLSAAAAVVVLVGLVLALVGHGSGGSRPSPSTHHVVAGPGPDTAQHRSTTPQVSAKPVHIKLLSADGSRVGVGMPVIAYFSKKITDGRPLQRATTVTVDGEPATADWYFERSAALRGYPYEAHLRLQHYWPAHSTIHVGIATAGVSAGKGMRFDDSLTLGFRTEAAHIVTVDDTTHELTLVSDGHKVLSDRVSLGARDTPTRRGVKVIMEKGASICMSGPGYDECGIKYTQRLTYDGEYLHSAPWNRKNIVNGVDSSNGCTNLLPDDAEKLYGLLRIGDVVTFPDANGPKMQLGNGYGDWNVPWSQWRAGGLVRTH